jgi:hypothetical protein
MVNSLEVADSFKITNIVYNKFMTSNNLQSILDHFGVGTFLQVKKTETIETSNTDCTLTYLETTHGSYVLIKFPQNALLKSELQDDFENKINFPQIVYVYPKEEKIKFAHVNGFYYSLRKI